MTGTPALREGPVVRYYRGKLIPPVRAAAESPADAVILPHHYSRFKIEPVRFIAENGIPFMPGNVIKYVCRHDAKNGVEDLKKARRYLDMMIAKAEKNEDWWK